MHSFGVENDDRMNMLLDGYLKQIPNSFTPSSIPQQQQSHPEQSYISTVPVRIAQQEESQMGGMMDNCYGGFWGQEEEQYSQKSYPSQGYLSAHEQQMNSYLRPSLTLATSRPVSQDFSDFYFPQHNEPSPYFNHRSILPPSVPRTPVTPAMVPINQQSYSMDSMPYSGQVVYVPTVVQGQDGLWQSILVPRIMTGMEGYDMAQQTQDIDCNISATNNYMDTYSTIEQSPFEPSFISQQTQHDDNEPVLVGMGLYDDPPELLYSSVSSTPEMATMGSLNQSSTGRGLVLEQSFGLPEDEGEDEEEEYDDEDEDEDEEEEE